MTVGEFWTPENPGMRQPGEFSAEVGKKPEVRLDAGLVADPRVSRIPGGFALSADPEKVVESFQPITLQGRLDTGQSVTLLDARNYGGDGRFRNFPRYVGHVAVLGDDLVRPDQLYSAVRFLVDHPYWLAHLAAGESSVVEDDGSRLSVEASAEGNWLVYESVAPATLRQLEIRVVSGCLVLVQLALDKALVTRETQVRLEPGGPWLTVHGQGFRATPGGADPDTLLPPKELTVERFAKWIALNDKLDGLAWAVARPVDGALQVQALVVTSLVEGLHRRLPYEQSRFPDVSQGALKRVREAARDAAATQAGVEGLDAELMRELVKQAVGHVGQVSFRDRAKAVVDEVCGVVPEISESVPDLPGHLTKARNDMAHHLLPDGEEDPLEVRYLRWLVVSNVTPWLLRGLLLLHAGIDALALRKGYLEHQRFAFFRANTTQHVNELGWELPSGLG